MSGSWRQAAREGGSSGAGLGDVVGYPAGSSFSIGSSLHDSGVHRPPQGGISGAEDEGADSIVVSGGYETYGDYIVYTGQGGIDPTTRKQVADH